MSHKPRLMIPALGAAVAALALLGCQKTDDTQTAGERAGQSMDRATQATKNAGDSAANKMSDATITTEVNTALAKDPDLSALKIDVDTSNGRVVLQGKAPTPQARERATQLAQGVKGVVSVDNKLTVGTS
jgi:osmotically-inducible protein OsmY